MDCALPTGDFSPRFEGSATGKTQALVTLSVKDMRPVQGAPPDDKSKRRE